MIPDSEYRTSLAESLERRKHIVVGVSNGKEGQYAVSRERFDLALISSDLRSYSCFEVLKFIRTTSPGTKVCFYLENESFLKDLTFDLKKGHLNLGINKLLFKREEVESMSEVILSLLKNRSWVQVNEAKECSKDASEIQIPDSKMTSVDSLAFYNDNISVFELYIRLGINKYIKILNRGEFFEKERIKTMRVERGIKELFFKTQDRISFINFFNQKLLKLSNKSSAKTVLHLSKDLSKKLVEEIYTQGIDRDIVGECVDHTSTVFRQIEKNSKLMNLFTELMEKSEAGNHAFSVSFISFVVAKNTPWATKRTLDIIGLASILHDIGKLKLDKKLLGKKKGAFSDEDWSEYKKHSKYGVQMLDGVSSISEAVKQVVFQHHEFVNGTGFPLGISGHKMFYPARILSLSDYLVSLIEEGNSPRESIKKLIENKSELEKFDIDVLRAFIKGLR